MVIIAALLLALIVIIGSIIQFIYERKEDRRIEKEMKKQGRTSLDYWMEKPMVYPRR